VVGSDQQDFVSARASETPQAYELRTSSLEAVTGNR
jgi:hypothetical protein